jgi:hypothetical protein
MLFQLANGRASILVCLYLFFLIFKGTPRDLLDNSGFITTDKFFRIPVEQMSEEEICRWERTLDNVSKCLAHNPGSRYSYIMNSHPESQYAVTKELLGVLYQDNLATCYTKIKTFKQDGVICEATIDDTHQAIFLGTCNPRGNVVYSVMGGYFSTCPMLIESSRVSFPYYLVMGIGQSIVLIFWYGGECSMQHRDTFPNDANILDISKSSIIKVEAINDIGPHPHKELCQRLLLVLKEATDNEADVDTFARRLNIDLDDVKMSVFSKLVKPAEITRHEKDIINSYVRECDIFDFSSTRDREQSIGKKHILIAILALLLGRDCIGIHLHLVDMDIIHTFLTDTDTQIVSKSKRRKYIKQTKSSKEVSISVPEWTSLLSLLFNSSYPISTVKLLYKAITHSVIKVINEDEDEENPISLQKIDSENYFKIDDISLGNELFPVIAVNSVDHECLTGRDYFASSCSFMPGIDTSKATPCEGCTNCKTHNKVYRQRRLMPVYCNDDWPKVIRECNANCNCSANPELCPNRVSQQGIRVARMQVIKTKYKGWGVRAIANIKQGEFIGNYYGEIVTEEEAERRGKMYDNRGLSYLFDIYPDFTAETLENEYSIDGTNYGNMTRLMNHSCMPNVIAVTVYSETREFPNIAFFAKQKIKKGEELTIDYMTHDSMTCHCGTPACRYRKQI